VGDTVIAVGNAGGKGTPTAAAGVVTGLNRAITAYSELSGTTEHLTGLVETDAAIESGQSGGPLVDTKGHVVGMVTAGSAGFAVSQSDSRGYAVPAPTFRSIATDIVRGRASATVHIGATAFLGVRVMSTQAAGALVVQIVSTSPAAAAGITPGDLIVGLGGQVVRSPETVAGVLGSARPGARLRVDLVDQSGEQRSVTATLVAGPPA
jgi:S1-C subfamily serine protease